MIRSLIKTSVKMLRTSLIRPRTRFAKGKPSSIRGLKRRFLYFLVIVVLGSSVLVGFPFWIGFMVSRYYLLNVYLVYVQGALPSACLLQQTCGTLRRFRITHSFVCRFGHGIQVCRSRNTADFKAKPRTGAQNWVFFRDDIKCHTCIACIFLK